MGTHLNHCILNPNQLCHHGVPVQDNPYANQAMHLASHHENFVLPMQADGTVIFFDIRTPTDYAFAHCHHVTLSSRQAAWNPCDMQFPTASVHHAEEEMYSISASTTLDLSTAGDNRHISQLITERLMSEVRVDDTTDVPLPRMFATGKRHSDVSAQELSERWFIGIAQAHETIKVKTQKYTHHSVILPLSRRYRADRVYEKPLLCGDFYTETMDGRCKSLDGNRFAQIMANTNFFAVVYPMAKKSEAGESLRRIITDYGHPERLTFDGSLDQCGRKTDFMSNVIKNSSDWHVTEPQRSNHNFAEGVIG
jgi:hypothetical protein